MTTNNGATPHVSNVKATFQAMLAPTSKPVSRKAWGIDVSTVWLLYFTAARVNGAINEMDLSDADLGAPFRLRRDTIPERSSSPSQAARCSPSRRT